MTPDVDTAQTFKHLLAQINECQALCQTKKNKDGKEEVVSGASVWEKAFANKKEMSKSYQKMYDALLKAYDCMELLGSQIEEMKAGKTLIDVPQAGLKEIVQQCLPGYVTEAVNAALDPKKLEITYSEALMKAVEKTQDKITEKANKTLSDTIDETLGNALQRKQQEFVEDTKSKADAENYERMRKVRNIVIKGVEESSSDDTSKRIKHDTDFVVNECGINGEDIVKIFRAGKPKSGNMESDSEVKNSPRMRPIIVTLVTPELAKATHKHGLGMKINDNIWINQDLTLSERIAAFKARKARRTKANQHV